MRRAGLILAVLILASVNLTRCADIVLSFKSGECFVDVQGDGRWKRTAVDMRVHEDSVIKTGKNSKVELMVDGEKVPVYRIKTDVWGHECTCVVTISTVLKQGQLRGIHQAAAFSCKSNNYHHNNK